MRTSTNVSGYLKVTMITNGIKDWSNNIILEPEFYFYHTVIFQSVISNV